MIQAFPGGSALDIPIARSHRRTWPEPRWIAPGLTVAGVVLWILLAASTNSGQFADNVEQFVWAQSVETSYWKHPPLPTWLLSGLIHLFGIWPGWTYVLGGLCFAGPRYAR